VFLNARVSALVQAGTRVLDVGCGEQPLRESVQARGGRYVPVDVERGPAGLPQVVGSALALPVRSASADLVLCSEVLEHVGRPESALEELARVLRPGGRLVLTVPFLYPLHEEPFDFVRLTPHHVALTAGRLGLAVDELAVTGDELQVVATVLDNMAIRALPADAGLLRRGLGVAWRLAVNSVAMAGSAALSGWLPRKAFLNVVAVLRRPSGGAPGNAGATNQGAV
jgi:ubiquinone/menaquinone biosynthesis C-methylase UbiE